MSILGRHIPFRIVALVALVLIVAAGALLPAMSLLVGPSDGAVREITLVARDMAFSLEGDPASRNPTIEVRAGERVRIVLKNRDRGFTHDFAVPTLKAATDALSWDEEASVVLDVPATPGTYEYVCRPHNPMMKGTIVVVH
jgi:plastocyanin